MQHPRIHWHWRYWNMQRQSCQVILVWPLLFWTKHNIKLSEWDIVVTPYTGFLFQKQTNWPTEEGIKSCSVLESRKSMKYNLQNITSKCNYEKEHMPKQAKFSLNTAHSEIIASIKMWSLDLMSTDRTWNPWPLTVFVEPLSWHYKHGLDDEHTFLSFIELSQTKPNERLIRCKQIKIYKDCIKQKRQVGINTSCIKICLAIPIMSLLQILI